MITVTRPYLPPLADYVAQLERIWERRWITNDGPVVKELEQRLADYLGVKHVLFTSNGTIAIQLALRALDVTGDVITTPFSYVATTSSLVWEQCTPVFVDIDPATLTLDPALVDAAITERTGGILATHVYGTPCDVDRLASIAAKHNIPVIYDAAHAFGAQFNGRHVAAYGNASTLSFHATKLFHTGEGGAVVTNSDETARRVSYMRSFGHDGPEAFQGLGINGKNSELHAAMGLTLLPHLDGIIARRRTITAMYDRLLHGLPVQRPGVPQGTNPNGAYYPLLFASEAAMTRTREALLAQGISTRRYFYPSLNLLPYVAPSRMAVSEDASSRVLCLPLYPDLTDDEVKMIADAVRNSIVA